MKHEVASYAPHALHTPDRVYRETNCYTDVLIELLHSRGLEPLAGLAHLVRTDFEGDQFTFFKMPPEDLEALYGIDVHEMQPVGALPDQIDRQLERGRTMLVELDSFFLPDTSGTDYRRSHVKTTVAAAAIDRHCETFLYFHNTGLHALSDSDYRGVFGLDGRSADFLPPYLELVRFDSGEALTGVALRKAARERLAFHLGRTPASNPFEAFGKQLGADLPRLLSGDGEAFHAYAFATVRMAGAAYDLLRAHVRWLDEQHATTALDSIVENCQVLCFRLARRRPFDPAPTIATMADAWEQAMGELERLTD